MRSMLLVVILAAAYTIGNGQSSYRDLTPGRSTRGDVEGVLGKSVRTVSATLLKYAPPHGDIGKLYVQYGDVSSGPSVERIELVCEIQIVTVLV